MSEAEYEVTTEGLDEAAALLARFPEIALDEMNKAMTKSVKRVSSDVKGFTPVYMGLLRSKIGGDVQTIGGPLGGIKGIVHSGGVPYASVVELGRRPGSWPPIAPLIRWVHLKRIAGRYSIRTKRRLGGWAQRAMEDVETARAIQIKIARKGIPGQYMFQRAWQKDREWVNAQFVRARDRIVRRLADIGVHVSF